MDSKKTVGKLNKFVPDDLLTEEYIKTNGTLIHDWDMENGPLPEYCYTENNFEHYERIFDKPMDKGGKPFTGILYSLYPSGKISSYSVYEDGYIYGADVSFYENGRLERYSNNKKDGLIYEWHENGSIKYFKENDLRGLGYYRYSEFDENGSRTKQQLYCEVNIIYSFINPEENRNDRALTWHENGEIKSVEYLSPKNDDFYTYAEFDIYGCPVRFDVNSRYNPDYMNIKDNRIDGRFKPRCAKYSENKSYESYTGDLCFYYDTGEVWKIKEYRRGNPCGGQYEYYKSGQIAEEYHIAIKRNGKDYYYSRYLKWYESGTLKEARIYREDMPFIYVTGFDERGNVTERLHL